MIKVLIVEDDPMVREINEGFLAKVEGFILQGSISSIERAKESILVDKPDLILLDIFFPQGKGTDLLKWIRSEGIKCDVILITADRNADTVEEAFRYGTVDYLVKPFVFDRFKEALLHYKDRKINFQEMELLEQSIIDKYTLKDIPVEDGGIYDTDYFDVLDEIEQIGDVKGFNNHTYEKVLEGIHKMNGKTFTALQIAKLIGVSRITARRYLDYLEKEKKLIVEMEYGKVGRPKNKYRVK